MSSAPLRQIFLDTETTGMKVKEGHRLVDIACIEYIDRKPTGRVFQAYLNPVGATMEAEALKVHGLTMEFLADKPQFAQIANDLVDFVRGAEIFIHNAPFDVGFVNAELARVNLPPLWSIATRIEDTLMTAASLRPGKRNNLDALCAEYQVDTSARELHGAMVDAQLLADVYIRMTDGQAAFIDDAEIARRPRPEDFKLSVDPASLARVSVPPEASSAHELYLDHLGAETKKTPLWRDLPQAARSPKP